MSISVDGGMLGGHHQAGNQRSPWAQHIAQAEQPPLSRREIRLRKLKALAERPGTEEEGETAQRLIDKMLGCQR
jgi:hypothetical protein